VNYDDETVMAYADGELEEARRAEIAAAIAQDPALAKRVQQHRALRADIAGAYSGVLDQPVPDHLREAARAGSASSDNSSAQKQAGNVVQFPTRVTRAPATPWRAREWTAMAASVLVGVFLTWRFTGNDFGASDGSLVARGELARALNMQLAANQTGDAPVAIGITFKSSEGEWCRSFLVRETATAGLACHVDDQWRIAVTTGAKVEGGDLRQAAAAMPPVILDAIESRRADDPLGANDELAARDSGWK
jgi:hypothetical protein